MRWPFRRRPDSGGAPATPPVEVPSPPPGERPAGAGVAGRRAWQALPPLTPVLGRPRTIVPPGLPDVSGTRSLLHRPATAAAAARPAGQVTGLATNLPALDLSGPPADRYSTGAGSGSAAPDVPAADRAPARRVAAVERPGPRPSLVQATPDFVGAPREPAEPHRAPAWLRALSGAPVMDPLLGAVASTPSPPRRPTPAPSSRAAVVPLRPVPGINRARRPHGRVGLGAPLPADGRDAPAGDPEPAAPAAQVLPLRPSPSAPPVGTPAVPGTVDRAEPPPYGLARAIATTYGTDLDGVLVHRGPTVDRRAQELQADAYAVDDSVHLPTTAGPVESVQARALLAHELVHLAQQRHLGPALPDESSPGGAALEAAALAVEEAVRSGAPLPALPHPVADRPPPPTPAPAPQAHRPPSVPPTTGSAGQPAMTSGWRPTAAGPVPAGSASAGSPSPDPTPAGPVRTGPASAGPTAAGRASAGPADTGRVTPGFPSASAGTPGSDGRAIAALGLPGVGAGAPVSGRVQRRSATLTHPRAAAPAPAFHHPAADQPAADHAAPETGAGTQDSSAHRTGGGRFGGSDGHRGASQVHYEQPRSGAEFRDMLVNTAGGTVFDAWSMDDPRDSAAASGGAGAMTGAGPVGGGAISGGGGWTDRGSGRASAAERQERYNGLYADRLQMLNEERMERNEPPLSELPYADQQRIERMVGGGHGQPPEPIRNFSEFGTALGNDLVDGIGSPFGLYADTLPGGAGSAAGSGSDGGSGGGTGSGAMTGASGGPSGSGSGTADDGLPSTRALADPGETRPLADSGRPAIDTDDLDLDELALRLYDRLRSKLRLELLLDRERAGLLSDFR